MPKKKNLSARQIRGERFSVPLNGPEKRLIGTAAGIAGEAPAAWARHTLKRFARMCLQKAGVKVRFDVEDMGFPEEPPKSRPAPPRRHKAPQPQPPTEEANGSPQAPHSGLADHKSVSDFRFPVPEED